MTPAERHLGAVLRVLYDAGRGPDLDELLDVLWLAGRLGGPAADLPLARATRRSGPPPAAGPEQAGGPDAPGTDEAGGPPPAADTLDRTAPELHAAPLPEPRKQRNRPPAPAAVAADPPARDRSALPLRVPEDKALPDELRIGRALRPLKQKRPSLRRQEIDENASAAAVAETGLPDVVMRPARERWFHLVLVVDDGLSMLLWHRLAVELRTTLQRLGAFRSIRVFGVGTRTPGPPILRGHPFAPDSSTMSASVPTDPSGHTLILVVSDGMGAAWHREPGPGSMHDTLLRWATSGPVAVVHALPAALWEGSGIRAERWQATTRRQGGGSTAWQITDRVLPLGLADFAGVPVPVLEPSPDAMHAWARLIMSPGTTVELPLLSRPGRHRPVAPPREAGDLQHFRDAASPGAYRLAAHLAAVSPVSIPVMRLVQSAVPWRATTAELAEVFLGGLLRPFPAPVPGPLPAQHRVFDFPEAAKAALLDAVPRPELLRTGRHIGRRLEELAGRSPDFPAWLAHPDGADRLPAAYRSFTAVERRLLTRFGVTVEPPGSSGLGTPEANWPGERWEPLTAMDPRQLGRYTLTGRRHGRRTVVYRGRGPGGELAAVCTAHPDMPSSTDQLVATQAEVLRRLDGRYAPALLATGLNDSPAWIAVQLVTVPGLDDAPPRLHHLLRTVSMDVLTSISLAWHLAGALSVCHLQGVVPAEFKADSVLVLGRSLLLTGLSDAAVDGEYPGPGPVPTAAGNVKSLGELLLLISSRKRETLPGLQNGMELWQGDTWRPLRALVARCLATNPDDRPTASEAAGVLARYVAIANELVARDGQTQGVRSARPAGGTALRQPLIREAAPGPLEDDSTARIGRRFRLFAADRATLRGMLDTIRAPLACSRRITVIGAHSGCGRVTTTLTLGSVIAAVRQEPVLALDGAPTLGALYGRLTHRHSATLRDLIRLPVTSSYADISRFTTHESSGLEVIGHGAARTVPSPAYDDEYRRVMAMAGQHYPVILTDWASARLGAAAEAVLELTDQLVLCCTATNRSMEAARQLMRALRDDHPGLVRKAVIVVAKLSGVEATLRGGGIVEHFGLQPRAGLLVPFDPHLSSRREIQLGRLKPRTADAYVHLASLVVAGPDSPR